MKLYALLVLAAISMVTIPAMAEDEKSSYWQVTTICIVYDNGDESMPECNTTNEYVEVRTGPPPPTVDVTIPEGALFPSCRNTDICFTPSSIEVEAGTEVVWTNNDNVLHSVTGNPHPDGDFDAFIDNGKSFGFQFDTVGTYQYGCILHPWAMGEVVVTGSTMEDNNMMMEDTMMEDKMSEAEMADIEVQEFVDELITLYMDNGDDALDMINARASVSPAAEVVGYVVDADSYILMAHNATPELIGLNTELLLSNAFLPIEVFKDLILNSDGVWLSYPLPDLSGNIVGYERGWLKHYDGYVFGARLSVTDDVRTQGVVGEMIRLYDRNPDTAFDTINMFMSTDPNYPFVLDLDELSIVAHGRDPALVGDADTADVVFYQSSVSVEEFRSLEEDEGIWVEYEFLDPSTGEDASKRSWMVKHDGYLFGSGYYP